MSCKDKENPPPDFK